MSPVFTSSIALAMAITPTLAAAQSVSDESPTERNKAVVRAYLGEIAKHGNIVARERYFTPTTTFNGDSDLGRQFARIAEFRRAFPDLEMTIEQQIAEGPWVATRVTYRGTHSGEWRHPCNGQAHRVCRNGHGSPGKRQSGGDVAHRKHASSDATNCRRWKPASETMIDERCFAVLPNAFCEGPICSPNP